MNTHTQTVKIHQCQAASVPSPSLRYYSASFKKGKRKAAKRKQKKIQRAARGESNGKQPKREDAFLFLPPTPLTFTQDALIASVRPPFLHSSWLIHPPALAFELGPFKKSADSVFSSSSSFLASSAGSGILSSVSLSLCFIRGFVFPLLDLGRLPLVRLLFLTTKEESLGLCSARNSRRGTEFLGC